MKKITNLIICLSVSFALLVLHGCAIMSLHPFCTKEVVEHAPKEIQGIWTPVQFTTSAKDPDAKPWLLLSDSLETFDEKHQHASLKTQYFKIDKNLYCSFTMSDKSSGVLGEYGAQHLIPAYTCSKVLHEGNFLKFQPMDPKSVGKLMEMKKIENYHKFENNIIFYNTPEQWMKIIKNHDKEIFSSNCEFSFKKMDFAPDSMPNNSTPAK